MQAYLRRTPLDLEDMADPQAQGPPGERRLRGASRAGFPDKKEVDRQYAFLTDWLFEKGSDPGIATHDADA